MATKKFMIGNSDTETYLGKDGQFTDNYNDARVFASSFEASTKMRQLQMSTTDELEILDESDDEEQEYDLNDDYNHPAG